jgi:hypothetical protein
MSFKLLSCQPSARWFFASVNRNHRRWFFAGCVYTQPSIAPLRAQGRGEGGSVDRTSSRREEESEREREWNSARACRKMQHRKRRGAKSRDPAQHRFRRSSASRVADGMEAADRHRTRGWIWHASKLAGDCPEIGTLSRSILSLFPFFPTDSRSFRQTRASWMHFQNVLVFLFPTVNG